MIRRCRLGYAIAAVLSISIAPTCVYAVPVLAQDWEGWDLAQVEQHEEDMPARLDLAIEDRDIETAPVILPLAGAAGVQAPLSPTGHHSRQNSSHRGVLQQAGSIGTELAIVTVYFGVQSAPKLFRETRPFHFKNEGWFGKDTHNIGMDKLAHAYNTYVLAELLHYRLHKNTAASSGDALTAAILASGFMALNEVSDAIEPDSGYSMQDIAMNVAGAGFSLLRQSVPGLKEKLAFKQEVVPNDQIYNRRGKKHYAQQRFFFAVKGAGFSQLKRTPLRYLDLQLGYYASDFLNSDREKGISPKRHVFVGVGLNVGEVFFGRSGSRWGRAAHSALDYIQLPYTSLRYDTTGRFGS